MSIAERMISAGAEYADPAISTAHGGEHGGMPNIETNLPSECLPEAVATFAAVSTIRCKRTSEVHRNGIGAESLNNRFLKLLAFHADVSASFIIHQDQSYSGRTRAAWVLVSR